MRMNILMISDREILDRNKNDIYKLIEIDEDGYSGYLAAVYDPSKNKKLLYNKNLWCY